LRLKLDTRDVGSVTIVHCKGRIVAGEESEGLRAQVAHLLRDRRSLLLDLGEVEFLDSSGLGTIVRSLSSSRQVRGDLKLCNVPAAVRKVLELSRLTKVFDVHDSEESAIAAFYRPRAHEEAPAAGNRSILCVDSNTDVLAYLREMLRRAGYDVHTTNHLRDAMLLMRITRFNVLLLGPDINASASARQGFITESAKIPVIELGDFSTQDAGEAGAGVLEKIEAVLNTKNA
jgi:anti-sigma B factor antagonist